MNKIIPIICIIVAAVGIAMSVIALILMSVAVSAHGLVLVSVPIAIISVVLSLTSTAATLLFLKDKLCRIAFFINLGALVVAIISLALWSAV